MQGTRFDPAGHFLDLGCGNGLIAETLSDCTGGRFAGPQSLTSEYGGESSYLGSVSTGLVQKVTFKVFLPIVIR